MTTHFNSGTSVLITGGTGSFGKAFLKTLYGLCPDIKRVVVYSRDELKQWELAQQYPPDKYPSIRYFLGDIRDPDRLRRALQGIDVVIHAAAMKQVPAAEYNPFEAIKTNILGAQNLIEACIDSDVKNVVALSTDKAASPVNLYGTTKLCSDKLFIAANNTKGNRDIKFSVVRYGNVMGSRGSVIPFFLDKRKSGVLPITHSEMTRFNITLPEAVGMVLYAIDSCKGGEILVPKIPSYRIMDLAEAVAPECRTQVVGIRPGEKLHEEMVTTADSPNTIENDQYYVIVPMLHGVGFDETMKDYQQHHQGRQVTPGFRYSSDYNQEWLSIPELRKLIREHVDPQFDVPDELGMEERDTCFRPMYPSMADGFLPYGRQAVDQSDIDSVVDVLKSPMLTTGPKVEAFEKAFAARVGAKYAVAVNSGTAALHLAMKVAGVGPGDRVVTSPNTFLASANAAAFEGATPDFADIDPGSLTLCPDSLRENWQSDTRAVVPVCYGGQSPDMLAIAQVARENNAVVIEDACHAVGGSFTAEGRAWNVGGHPWADMTTFSFHPVKTMTTGEGGMLVTDNPEYAEMARCLRTHGMVREPSSMLGFNSGRPELETGPWVYEMQELGFNYRMTDMQCALGLSQLEKLDEFVLRRQSLVERYNANLAEIQGLSIPEMSSSSDASRCSWHLYTVQIDFESLGVQRADLMSQLRSRGIGTQVLYIPVYWQPWYQRRFGYRPGKCPNAERFYARALSLPLFPAMNDADVDRVTSQLLALLNMESHVSASA